MEKFQPIDDLDLEILNYLISDGRMSYLDVARQCNISGSTVHLRINKLEQLGIIKGCSLEVDYEKLGVPFCVFLLIKLKPGYSPREFIESILQNNMVAEANNMLGEYNVLLKLRAPSLPLFRAFIDNTISNCHDIVRYEVLFSIEEMVKRPKILLNR